MHRPGLAPLAQAQLAGWQEIADPWELITDPGGSYARCHKCGQAIIRLFDDAGRPYAYPAGSELALKVAQLRQAHQELDPDR